MNRYHCQSKTSTLLLTYDHGSLTQMECTTGITAGHIGWVYEHKLTVEEHILGMNSSSIKVEKLAVTFDEFWNAYPHKVGKKKAREKWEKMKDEVRLLAYKYLPKYIKRVERERIAFKEPLTYLNSEIWEDEN